MRGLTSKLPLMVSGQTGNCNSIGKHEGTTAEHAHVTGKGAGTLREHHQRHTFLQHLARLIVRGTDLGRSALVYEDVVGIVASQTYQRDLTDAFLHHPLEVTSQEAIDQEDVESTLMIGYKHIALVLLQMFPTLYLDGQQEDIGSTTVDHNLPG